MESKSAKEMFEELGYTKSEDDSTIKYTFGTFAIIFYISDDNFYKSFEVCDVEDEISEICNMDDLKAINQQCIELGWI